MKPYTFPYEGRTKVALQRAKKELNAKNFALLQGFANAPNCVNGNAISNNRKYKRILVLRELYNKTGKPFTRITEKELEVFMAGMRNAHTRASTAALIKSFYRWLDAKKYEELIKCKALKAQNPYTQPGNVIESKNLLSQKECLALLQAANNKRDRCLFALLIGSGFRIGEAMSITRDGISFGADSSVIASVNGKTGKREVKIHNGLAKYVKEWYEAMPRKEPSTPLFTTMNGQGVCSYSILQQGLASAKKRAGITKPLTFHKLRHRHATWALINMPRQLAYKRMGWTQNSDMAAVYSHVDDAKANEAYEEALGLKPAKLGVEQELLEKQCLNCGKRYEPTRELCSSCGIPLGQVVIGPEDALLFKKMVVWFRENKGKFTS